MLDYHVIPVDAAAHRYRVILRTPATPGERLTVALPVWIPGSYVVRDFARHLLSITAESAGQALAVESVDRARWACTPAGDSLTVTCEFYARDASVRAAFLDDSRGLFNFTSLALRPLGTEDQACSVRLDAPVGRDGWRLVTTLEAAAVDGAGFGDYRCDSYWSLIDQPVALGPEIEEVVFEVRGVPHAFVLLGGHDADTARLARDLRAICEAQAAVFDALPTRRYLFLAQIAAGGYGGLEHRDSCVLQVARDALPPAGQAAAPRSKAYETLLGLCSHEYFHLWNVKRIRPAAVAASDLQSEAYFRDLWAYEGVTSYYDDLGLVRAGVLDEQAYLDRLARLATVIERTPGRHRQSLAQSSFDAWLKFYRPDENTPNAVVSYYGKGAQFALGLDHRLQVETNDALCLDAVLRELWQRQGRHDAPVAENGLARLAAEMSGLDLDAFVARHLETAAEAPWADYLGHFGIAARREPATDDAAILQGRLGLRLAGGPPPRVQAVFDEGPAQAAGLSPADRIVAVDGLEATADLAQRLQRYPAGMPLAVHLLREDRLLVREVVIGEAAACEWQLTIDPAAPDSAHERRRRWLGHAHAAA